MTKPLSDLILEILSRNSDVSIKIIHYKLKKEKSKNVSYQAVHKAINKLLKLEKIISEGKLYSLNPTWLIELENFIETTRKSRERAKLNITKNIRLKNNKLIKVISFDLDGCLSDNTFDDLFWDREIPKLVAQKNKISFEEAYKFVVKEYELLWGKVEEWRDPEFWLKHFDLEVTWDIIINDLKKEIKHYGDSIPVLKELKENYVLIITSHADRKFLDLKIGVEDLSGYFDYTFSTTSDFGSMKKDSYVFKQICKILGVKATEVVHIGDNYEFDYMIPTSVGINSFLIDRSGKLNEDYVVRSMYHFVENVKKLG